MGKDYSEGIAAAEEGEGGDCLALEAVQKEKHCGK